MNNLLSISQFSQRTRLTAKTLRFYDEQHLLRPAFVDEVTGYRYYSLSQFADAEKIHLLRRVSFPLEDIRLLLRLHDPAAFRSQLDAHRAALIRQHRAKLLALDELHELASSDTFPAHEIFVKRVDAQPYISLHLNCPPASVCQSVHNASRRLSHHLRRADVRPAGPGFAIYHSPDDRDVWEVEVGVPVPSNTIVPETDGVAQRWLGSSHVAFTVHAGPYEGASGLDPAYHVLNVWLQQGKIQPLAPMREIYLFHPENTADPDDYRVELACPIQTSNQVIGSQRHTPSQIKVS